MEGNLTLLESLWLVLPSPVALLRFGSDDQSFELQKQDLSREYVK